MTGTTKKILTALLAVAAAVCLAFGLFLSIPKVALAETAVLTLTEDYLNIDRQDSTDVKFLGLKDKSSTETLAALFEANAKFDLDIPDGVNTIVDSNSGVIPQAYRKNLINLSLPDSVKKIGSNAFNKCVGLTSVTFNTNPALTTIGMSAFEGCTSLTAISIPKNVKDINSNAFRGCSSLTTIHYNALEANPGIASPFDSIGDAVVYITGVKTLPAHLFRGTNIKVVNFSNVNIPAVGGWGVEVFRNCAKLTNVIFDSNCTVAKINDLAFSGCSALLDISLPSSVREIAMQAFANCTSLINFTVPASTVSVAADAFTGCTNILEVVNKTTGSTRIDITKGGTTCGGVAKYAQNVIDDEANTKFKTEDNFIFFATETETRLIRYTGTGSEIILPVLGSGYFVKKYIIHDSAFKNNTSLTSVIFPSTSDSEGGVWKVGKEAFRDCTALRTIRVSENVVEIGELAFYGCKALTSITLPDKLSIIGKQLFMDCSALTTIKIPSGNTEIGIDAFKNCTSLKTVEFTPNTVNGNKYRTEKIEAGAFEGCTSLESITINDAYTSAASQKPVAFGGNVFNGCTKLKAVVIPSKLSANNTTFAGIGDAFVVAPSKGAYTTLKNENTTLSALGSKFTYNIPITFEQVVIKATDTSTVTAPSVSSVNRYYGVTGQTLPNQIGYSNTVWYTAKTDNNELMYKVDSVNALLAQQYESLTLYAYYTEKPTIENNQTRSVAYNGNDQLTTQTGLWFGSAGVGSAGSSAKYTASILKYKDMSDMVSESQTELKDAGTYTLSIGINKPEDYGTWAKGVEVLVKVEPKNIVSNMTEVDEVEWGVSNGASINYLNPTDNAVKLYGYSDGKYYLEKQKLNDSTELEVAETIDVLKSYVMWDASKDTVVRLLKEKVSTYFDVNSVNYSVETTKRGAGKYRAVAEVKFYNNFKFELNEENKDELKKRGLDIMATGSNNCYLISKTWYIISSNSNKLLLGNNLYSVPNWAYADNTVNLVAPSLWQGNNDKITLSLIGYEGTTTAEGVFARYTFNTNNFATYVNNTMPVGNYLLTATVSDVEVDGTTYSGGVFTYQFAISKTTVLDRLGLLNHLDGKVIRADYTANKRNIGINKDTDPILSRTDIHPARKGVWYNSEYNKYYTNFVIRFSHEITGALLTEQEHTGIQPSNIGNYRIRFEMSAPGYEVVAGTYDLVIMGAVNKPSDAEIDKLNIVYTGQSLANKIDFKSDYFNVVFLDGKRSPVQRGDGTYIESSELLPLLIANNLLAANTVKDDYIAAGEHRVALFLKNTKDSNLLKWSELAGAKLIQGFGECAILKFTIKKADNSTAAQAYIRSWEWGAYDATLNAPTWETVFPTEKTFTLVSQADATIKYPYDKDNGFKNVPVGSYWLVPCANGNANVSEFDTISIKKEWVHVDIQPATIQWKTVPYINSWTFGQDNLFKKPTYSLIDRQSNLENNLTAYICKVSDYGKADGKKYTSIEDLKSKNNKVVPAGNWVYVIELPVSGDYERFEYPVYFSVVAAENYWDKTPVIHDFKYGGYTNKTFSLDIGVPHFRRNENAPLQVDELEICVYDEKGVMIQNWVSVRDLASTTLLDKFGQLPVGSYEYRAKVYGEVDYKELVFLSKFYITRAANSWVDVPNVLGWSEGNFKDECVPVAKAQFGTVFITVKDASGNVVEGLEKISLSDETAMLTLKASLKGLKVGNYTLVAEVAGSSSGDYDGIKSEVVFAVYEDTVKLGGLIAAIVVFTIIALGLAGAGIFLLIRRNAKVEEEFRKFMKKELRRK